VEYSVWSFTRGIEHLQIRRQPADEGVTLSIVGDGAPRSYVFSDEVRLEAFQRDMETLLLNTGWTFDGYAPDQRHGRDRRGWPRNANDRRRWWTDGRPTRKRQKETNCTEPFSQHHTR
jgi:hypothetical protein